jgi:LuxR family maltose regulon positive regulatory protein
VLALEDGDPHAAGKSLDAAGPLVDMVEHWTIYALVRARRDRLAGEVEAGLVRVQRLREQRGSAPLTPMARSLLDAAEAELLLAAGEPAEARRIAARSAKHSAPCGIALARAELALNRTSEAAVQAHRVLSTAGIAPRNRLEAELVLACSALRTGHERDAATLLPRIAELVRSTGMRAPLRAISLRDRDALREGMIHAGVSPDIVSLIAVEASRTDADVTLMRGLSPREQAVLEVLAETGAIDEIAARLYVSRNTVKSQLRTVYRKLGVSSREAALTRAAVLGLLEDPAA